MLVYTIYQYVTGRAQYNIKYTRISMYFVEDIVTQLCGRWPSLFLSQNKSMTREILLPAQRTKGFLSGLMQQAWKRQ